MEHETAGDPISGLKWTRKTTRKISAELRSRGIAVSASIVARLLKQLDFRLRVNHKKICLTLPEERDEQFGYIQKPPTSRNRGRSSKLKDSRFSVSIRRRRS